jgi:hypothetical protein
MREVFPPSLTVLLTAFGVLFGGNEIPSAESGVFVN